MKYGPNTPAIERLIARAKSLTRTQCRKINADWDAIQGDVWNTAWGTALNRSWGTGRGYVLQEAWRDARTNSVSPEVTHALRSAVLALVVQDQISEEHFQTLCDPWGSVLGDPK